jgi:hypothetical protein
MRAALLGTADAALAATSITQIAIVPNVNTRMERSHENGRDGVATAYAGLRQSRYRQEEAGRCNREWYW